LLPLAARDEPLIRRQKVHALLLADRAAESRVRLQPLIAPLAASSTILFALMGLAGAVAATDGDAVVLRRQPPLAVLLAPVTRCETSGLATRGTNGALRSVCFCTCIDHPHMWPPHPCNSRPWYL